MPQYQEPAHAPQVQSFKRRRRVVQTEPGATPQDYDVIEGSSALKARIIEFQVLAWLDVPVNRSLSAELFSGKPVTLNHAIGAWAPGISAFAKAKRP
jgi:hypothetical protein